FVLRAVRPHCGRRPFPTRRSSDLLAEEIRTVSLNLKSGAVTESVTITAEVNPIQLTESKVAGDIGNLISFTPGVTGTGNAQRNADRKRTRLNSSHDQTPYAVFCLK